MLGLDELVGVAGVELTLHVAALKTSVDGAGEISTGVLQCNGIRPTVGFTETVCHGEPRGGASSADRNCIRSICLLKMAYLYV